MTVPACKARLIYQRCSSVGHMLFLPTPVTDTVGRVADS